jgi:hypothetical protein
MKVIDALFNAIKAESERLDTTSDIEIRIAIARKIGGLAEVLEKAVETSRAVKKVRLHTIKSGDILESEIYPIWDTQSKYTGSTVKGG